MRAIKLSRKLHKWFALFLGIQMFLWALSGFYMVTVHIDIIHGDMLVNDSKSEVAVNSVERTPLNQLVADHPDARSVTLTTLMDQPVYLVAGDRVRLVDPATGRQLSPIDETTAGQIARFHYSGDAPVVNVELLEDNPPTELQSRPLPLWRVDFDDKWNSSFYINPDTGEFTTRRHTLWRVFDFLWMLHVMDYDTRDDINNLVLRIFSGLGLLAVLSGIWLLFYSFKTKQARGSA